MAKVKVIKKQPDELWRRAVDLGADLAAQEIKNASDSELDYFVSYFRESLKRACLERTGGPLVP
jgi:hypothetical protein